MATPDEVPLTGGRLTAGVVRIGDTVRRPCSPASPFVAALLTHFEQQGFTGAPRFRGVDQAGRDVLTYMEGLVPARFQRWTDEQVAAAGRLLRSLHDATRGSALAGGQPVVVHGDAGPNNAVFRHGQPVAFIDYDTAAPGLEITDVAYAGWTWVISSRPGAWSPGAQAAQLRVLTDAYGIGPWAPTVVVEAILERQRENARWWRAKLSRPGPHPATPQQILERAQWSEREHAFTLAHQHAFESALG